MKKRQILGIVLGIAFLSASTAQAKVTWMCNIFTGPKHFVNKPLKTWGKWVGKATNGEVKVRYLPTSAAPPPKQMDGIIAGTYDCAFIFHAFTARKAVGGGFGIVPFINPGNAEQGSVAFWRTWSKYFEGKKEFHKHGIKILSQFQFPGVHYFTAKNKPINSIEDMKSMKMWALAGPSSKTLKAAGVNHVSGPAARMAEFTQTKVVQGIAGTTRSGAVIFAGVNFAKWGTFTSKSVMSPSFAWMLSKKKWDALSAANRAAITKVSGEKLSRAVGQIADTMEIKNSKKLKKAGFKEIKASKQFEANLMAAAKPQRDAWVKRAKSIGVDGNAVIQHFIAEASK